MHIKDEEGGLVKVEGSKRNLRVEGLVDIKVEEEC